ncbi:MAG: proline--tRNA ligase, partial [Muribaculaceae bacterium]|nr:proline--tRNA ligase [Muribaculaceae bacterium]
PIQVVIVPIYKNDDQRAEISEKVLPIVEALRAKGISVKYDDADNRRPGFKFADYELKGVPVRLAIGARDLANGTVEIMRRDTLEKETDALDTITERIPALLEEIQDNIYRKALSRREERTVKVDNYEDFKAALEGGNFILAHWDGSSETEERIKEETKATIRCIPLDSPDEEGVDMLTGKPSHRRVLFARNY